MHEKLQCYDVAGLGGKGIRLQKYSTPDRSKTVDQLWPLSGSKLYCYQSEIAGAQEI